LCIRYSGFGSSLLEPVVGATNVNIRGEQVVFSEKLESCQRLAFWLPLEFQTISGLISW
jgi:hypothetical protein